jgi:uncharacterized protein (TIGR02118 family)
MVRITILYPQTPHSRFDMDYYLGTHMPMSLRLLRTHAGFRALSVERGTAGPDAAPAPFVAACHYLFESAEAFMSAFAPHAAELQGDIANYTDIAPVIQVGVVEIMEQGRPDSGAY